MDLDFKRMYVLAPKIGGEMSKEEFKKWKSSLKQKNIKFYFDNDANLVKKIGVRAFPTNTFVNSKGEVKIVQPGLLTKEDIIKIMKEVK